MIPEGAKRISVPWYAMEHGDVLYCVVARPVNLSQWGLDTEIPSGFMSDGMSVPKFFWRWLGPKVAPVTVSPSIVHDWLYKTHIVSRKEADKWYRDALIHNGYSKIKAYACYAGLRLCGWSHWD